MTKEIQMPTSTSTTTPTPISGPTTTTASSHAQMSMKSTTASASASASPTSPSSHQRRRLSQLSIPRSPKATPASTSASASVVQVQVQVVPPLEPTTTSTTSTAPVTTSTATSTTTQTTTHPTSSQTTSSNIGAKGNEAYYASLPINVLPTISPSSPASSQPVIGLIGMGAMGRMYARALGGAGWVRINVCDLPEKYEDLKKEYADNPNITPMRDGHAVSRSSDFIVYSVEAEFIDRVVKAYGPSTKVNAIVAGQTSVKAPEKEAFEKYLPKDVHIVSCHSLHGPSVSPLGQPLIIIRHRSSLPALTLVENILRPLKSRHVHLSYAEHDIITASTQAVTHAAFLSMGSAWSAAKSYPWEEGWYVGGIETAKVNLTLRIYSNSWHVYAGLAILNPEGKRGIERYAQSAGELFKLMIAAGGDSDNSSTTQRRATARERARAEGRRRFRERVEWARDVVFGKHVGVVGGKRRPILLSEDVLDRFSLGKLPESEGNGKEGVVVGESGSCGGPMAGCCPPGDVTLPVPVPSSSTVHLTTTSSSSSSNEHTSLSPSRSPSPSSTPSPHSPTHPPSKYRPNSHLSLLAMVDCWAHLGINPYEHLELAATPLFRLFLGVAEWLFLAPAPSAPSSSSSSAESSAGNKSKETTMTMTPLSQAIHSALYDTWHRSDDLEFVIAARGWSQAVSFGSFEVYKRRFEETRGWFEREGRFADGEVQRVGNEMIKAVMESEVLREEEEGISVGAR